MRDAFVRTLVELAKQDKNIELFTGDLGFGVLKPFIEECGEQFTNCGIAEQNMMSLAAGMSKVGKTVVVYSIGNFPTIRCLEQIRNDCCYQDCNVKIVAIGGGFTYGSLGMSHHATDDLSVLRGIPGLTLLAPGDAKECEACVRYMIKTPGTFYLRLERGGGIPIHKNEVSIEDILKGIEVTSFDSDTAIVCTGGIITECYKASNELNVPMFSVPVVKPFPVALAKRLAVYKKIVTVEENNIVGGLGSALLETSARLGLGLNVKCLGIGDEYCHTVGNQDYLRDKYNLSSSGIIDFIKNL